MKNLFTLLFIFLATFTLKAQVVFQQDFENGMAPMTIVDNDGKTPATQVAAYAAAWTVATPGFGNGTKVAISNSWYTPPGAADDWMITPAITITDPNTILTWEAKAQDASYPDGYQVRVSTGGNTLPEFTDIIFSLPAEQTTWQQRGASLADYVGQTIHIAFRNNSNDMYLLLVDNIVVASIQDKDVAMTDFNSTRFHPLGSNVAINATVKNQGGEPLNSFDFHWSDGISTYTETITGLNLAYGESQEVTHSVTFNLPQAKSFNIAAWADNPNGGADGDPANNQVMGVLSGVTYIPAKKSVGEEGTGTWCGWCPRGTDFMEYMTGTYPDQFIGIAVHNGDPMTVTAYDDGANFSAFPNAYYDRAIELDPSDFETELPTFQARVAPVAPSIEASIDVATKKLTIDAAAEFVTELEGLDYRLAVVLTEDEVKGTGAAWNQANYYSGQSDPLAGWGYNWQSLPNPAPAAGLVYNHVGRLLVNGYAGEAGSIPASVVAGDVASKTYTVNNFNTGWNPFNMHAVVMVLDNSTGEILNAESSEIDVVCPADFNVSVQVTNATQGNADGAIQASVAVPTFGFGGYTFSLSNGSTGGNITGLAAGDYTLTVSDKIGCTQTVDVTVGTIVSVEDMEQLAAFSLTPNPAATVAMMNARFKEVVDAELTLVNALGQVMERVEFNNASAIQHQFELGNYVNGVYMVKINVGNQVYTERLVIAH
ncbi:MAG: hypothetical protein RI973_1018 [Bacteroidota bacterium]|jgi:hypothetical protein